MSTPSNTDTPAARRLARIALAVFAATAALALVVLLVRAPVAVAAAGREPFAGGASNLKALWSDWATPLFAILATGVALHHYGSRDYGKLAVFLVAGAVVGWIIGDPQGHLSSLGTHLSNLLGL
jgi:Na+/H+ antiporter NhaA